MYRGLGGGMGLASLVALLMASMAIFLKGVKICRALVWFELMV